MLLGACAQATTISNPAGSLARAERDFAASGSRMQVNDAFLRVLAPDAILFRPGPVDAREYLRRRPMLASLLLLWEPTYAEASADGTIGVTTGPSEYGQRPDIITDTGYFLSVWRRTGKTWQLVLDVGIDAPLRTPLRYAAATLTLRNLSQSFPDAGGIGAVEDSVAANFKTEFAARAAEDARVYREGTAPTSSKRDAIALVSRDDPASYGVSKVVVAASGDLAYVYGTVNPHHAEPDGYVRIYRRGPDGRWTIAFDWR